MKKAAIVIGVDKTGKLTPLSSAAAGAERIAAWLEGEKFTVKCITDSAGPVEYSDVEKAVQAFVTVPPRYHLLLVYFSGHGYWQARSDVWLLSGAPVRTGEAINLETAMDLAKYSGIPNVVFISDACRSIPDSRSGANIVGNGVFPNHDEITSTSKIDYFKATSEALPAYEGTIAGKPQSLLTVALMSAYEEPEVAMVRQIVEGRETIEVVPNRNLEDYLQKKVDRLLAVIDPTLSQRIEINVPSSDDVYLARVRRLAPGVAAPPPPAAAAGPPPAPQPGREAAAAVSRSLSTRTVGAVGPDPALVAFDFATETKLQSRLPDRGPDRFETQMGFVVHGARVLRAIKSPQGPDIVNLLEPGDGASIPGVVRVEGPGVSVTMTPASVAVQLADERWVILAGLPGYIGHVTVDDDGVSNVSYVPSANNQRWGSYAKRREEIDRLRASVALAVDHNRFRLQSNIAANALAKRIRIDKAMDPTLGLYAAHAFSQAGNEEQIVSVLNFMRNDLKVDLFDVWLLASRHPAAKANRPRVPFCPMLTQSWSLLRARHVELPSVLQEASAYLCSSLWTTFEPRAGRAIIDAILGGQLS